VVDPRRRQLFLVRRASLLCRRPRRRELFFVRRPHRCELFFVPRAILRCFD
jgi:hypothetical protein